jgi:hypothetical protein
MRSAICFRCQPLAFLGTSRRGDGIVVTYVLVDQYDRNVLPLPGELVESFLDSGLLGFGIDDEVVFLGVWGFGDMLYEGQSF